MENKHIITSNSFVNIYDLEHFELYSQTRDKCFRFVKFTGENYKFLKDYLLNGRENLEVWPFNRLKRNFYYTIGRNLIFQEIELLDLRCCIASNPFLVTQEGIVSLSLDIESAKSYLKENEANYVFCYNEFENDALNSIKNLYRFDHTQNTYFLYNQDHKRGFSINDLPCASEWFIGNFQDGLVFSQRVLKAVSTRENHSVRFDVDFEMMVNRIVQLIYQINKLRFDAKEPIIFNPSWEDYERFRVIGKAVTSTWGLSNFAIKLYNIIYEETKSNGKNRAQLPLKDHKFVKTVNELRNYFSHGRSEYENTGLSISDICENYSVGSSIPEDLSGFNRMQEGILQDFILFLSELHNFVKKNAKIKGRILCNQDGDIYCDSVLFPENFQRYVNCFCQISVGNRTENLDRKTSTKYKFYCDQPDYIELIKKIEGKIYLKDNIPYCEDVRLSEVLMSHVGKAILISKIRIYKEATICYEYTFREGIAGVVYLDEDGNKIVEDILLADDLQVEENDCVYLPSLCPSTNKKYSSMCMNPRPFEGVVQKDGFYYHCGPFLLSPSTSYKEGDTLRLCKGKRNEQGSTNEKYKYFVFKWKNLS